MGLRLAVPVLCLLLTPAPGAAEELRLEQEGAALSGTDLRLRLTLPEDGEGARRVVLQVPGGPTLQRQLEPGVHELALAELRLPSGRHLLRARAGELETELELRVLPGWLSVVPPLVAIVLALLFKDVLLALFAGVYSGALFLFEWNPLVAFGRTMDHFIVPSLADPDQASILVFSTLLGGMVGVISRSGGTQGIVDLLQPHATNDRRGQLATWMMGVMIFFDDYANTLIVGSTMRPVTDRLRVSREKLAYIVDSTAAPVACIIPISTWVGFQVGLIAAAFGQLALDRNGYTTFLAAIPYQFYPILALVMVFSVSVFRRDLGPMLSAERRARNEGKLMDEDAVPLGSYSSDALEPPEGAPRRALNAFIPILTVILVTLYGLYASGAAGLDRGDYPGTTAWIREVLGNADSYAALLWASLSGAAVALLLAFAQRILSIRQGMEALVEGFKSMLLALVVLVLAWSIGAVCDELHTADYLVALTREVLSPHWLPALVFLLAAAVAFATGSSWGTMAILTPLVVPIAHGLSITAGFPPGSGTYEPVLLGSIASVLAGSVWGDHCSPISDTTILSSMASGCDHIAHVRTQLPYAVAVGALGLVLGSIPTAFGMSPWISLLLGSAAILAGVRWLGGSPHEQEPATPPERASG